MKKTVANESTPATDKYLRDAERTVSNHFAGILHALSIDTKNDPNTQGTADRVAKMFVREIFTGRFQARPKITVFPNTENIDELIVVGPLTVKSMCSHHFMPIVGEAWIGYLPSDKLIGLSKFPRIVDWYSRRPQIQEELTAQIAQELHDLLQPRGIGVHIRAAHFCMSHRGVNEHPQSRMLTTELRGSMRTNASLKAEFLSHIK